MGIDLTGIDHPAMAVSDVETVTDWYCEVLGYEKAAKKGDSVWIIKAPDGTFIEMMQQNGDPRSARAILTPGWSHLAFRVSDLEAAIAFLESKKVAWLGEIIPAVGGGRLRSFADPDGNMLQVVER